MPAFQVTEQAEEEPRSLGDEINVNVPKPTEPGKS